MKVMVFFVAFIFITVPMIGQEKTLLTGEIESGGYGGPNVQITKINKEDALFVGGVGGWIINHSFVLGGGGYGLVTDVSAKFPDTSDGSKYLDVGYGGLYLEYTESSNEVIHLTFGLLIGGGGVGYRNQIMTNTRHDMETFLVLEPNVQLNLNITHFFRISTGANYRYISGINTKITSDSDLSGPSAVLTFRFGKF